MRPSLQIACDRVVDRLLLVSSQVEMLMPPQNVLSDEQQVQLYLSIVANPLAVDTLKLVKGADVYRNWAAEMMRKAKLLGAASVRVTQLQDREKDEIFEVARQATTPEEFSREQL